jgi:type I restriction enzyme S subunit
MSKLATLALPVPPADEMTTILQRLRVAESSMSTLTSTVYAAAELQRKAQASVLARAFRGELVPQDPNDEPAEAMLARVRGRAEPQRRVGQS